MAEPRQMRTDVQGRAAELSAAGEQIPEHLGDEEHAGANMAKLIIQVTHARTNSY